MEGDHGQRTEPFQWRRESTGRERFLERLSGVHQEIADKRQEPVSIAHGGGVGVFMSGWDGHAVSLWGIDFCRSGELQWLPRLHGGKARSESEETHAGRQFCR